MTITVKYKLHLTKAQQAAIDNTMEVFVAACNDALEVGHEADTTSNVKIHDRCYYDLREKNGLPVNLAVRPTSIDYDTRTVSFKEADWSISLSTVESRHKPIALDIGDCRRNLLEGQKPRSALFKKRVNGEWTYVEYKAALAGLPAETVDAAYTSHTCPKCGRQEKGNRPSQDTFVCQSCQHSSHADGVGALSISIGDVVNRPEVAPADAEACVTSTI
jgi:predicted transposase